MDQPSPGLGIYDGRNIRNSIHLCSQWARLAVVLIQLYEGTNHAPLPKDKHLGILSQVESPCGQIGQLEVCQLLSARLQVVYPVGLNGGNQSVTMDLPGPLHGGSSITTNKHLYMRIDIPSPTPEEQDSVDPPLDRGHTTQTIAMPKMPWKSSVTLMAEVGKLLTRGMTEDYDHEPEHSATEKELVTKADISPPPKMEVSALPLDTSSQASIPGTEASIESNPVHNSPTAVADSSHSDSPAMDLPEFQADANLAINNMLTVRRSLELERQQVIWDYEVLLHKQETKTAAANERAKIACLRKGLQARVKCTKAVMRVKYNNQVAVQEARATQCNELEEAETAYSEALCKNAAMQSLHFMTLCMEHAKHMSELEDQALEVEVKSQQDFLSTHSAVLCHAPLSLKVDLHSSYNILLGNSSSLLQSFPSVMVSQVQGQPPATPSPKSEPTQSQWPKRQNPSPDLPRDTFLDEDSPKGSQEDLPCSKTEKTSNLVLFPQA